MVTTKQGRVGATVIASSPRTAALTIPKKGHYLDLWVSFDRRRGLKMCTLVEQASGSLLIDSVFHRNVLTDLVSTPFSTGNGRSTAAQISGGTDSCSTSCRAT